MTIIHGPQNVQKQEQAGTRAMLGTQTRTGRYPCNAWNTNTNKQVPVQCLEHKHEQAGTRAMLGTQTRKSR
jgi:hypothetical protein